MSDWFIRDGASGSNNGTDWTNAWEDMDDITWGVGGVQRGDAIYIADGIYINDTFDLAESGTDYVYVIKATSSAHGTETGWDSGYGDGVATFQNSGTVKREATVEVEASLISKLPES